MQAVGFWIKLRCGAGDRNGAGEISEARNPWPTPRDAICFPMLRRLRWLRLQSGYSDFMTSFRTRPSRSSQALSPLFLGKIVSRLCTVSLFLLTAASPLAAGSAAGTDNGRGFRWINPTSDAELWKEVA